MKWEAILGEISGEGETWVTITWEEGILDSIAWEEKIWDSTLWEEEIWDSTTEEEAT